MFTLGRPPLSDEGVAAHRCAVLAWHADHALRAPWRASRDPYQVLVAAVMAQQTQIARELPPDGGEQLLRLESGGYGVPHH